MGIDHPRHRYPEGSLVRLERGVELWYGSDSRLQLVTTGDEVLIILGYEVGLALSAGFRAASPTWFVKGLCDGRIVRTQSSFGSSEMMKIFTMCSDIRDAHG